MSLTTEQVRHIAKLGQLRLSDDELEVAKGQLNDILQYVEQVCSVPTRGVAPLSHVHGVTNAFRDDVIRESLPISDLEQNAPDFAEGCFRVPRFV